MGSLKPPPSLLSLLGNNKHRGVISGIGDAVTGNGDAVSGNGDAISGNSDVISGNGDAVSGNSDVVSGSRIAFHRSEAGPCVVCTTTQQVDGETLDGITRVRPDLKAVFSITNPVLLFR